MAEKHGDELQSCFNFREGFSAAPVIHCAVQPDHKKDARFSDNATAVVAAYSKGAESSEGVNGSTYKGLAGKI